jgi:hypothetical protein
MKVFRHKFSAVRTQNDGFSFASKKEAARYAELKLLKAKGEVLFFLMQTPFHMAPKCRYVCDFTVFWKDGTVTFEDVKGFKTSEYKTKKKVVEQLYGVEITEI